jgi:hypothetical protein
MKKIVLLIVFAFVLGLTGCSKDAEVNAFITEFDSVTKEIVSNIESDPSPNGVDAAQKAFDGKKAALKEKWDAIKDAVGFQVSADTKKKLESSVETNMKSLMAMATKHGAELSQGGGYEKFKKLMDDYQAMFAMPK